MEALDAVHFRHHVVHEDAVVVVVLGQPQALRAAGGRVDLDFCIREQLGYHHQVHVVVVHHENVGLRGLEALAVGLPLVGPRPGGQGKRSQFPLIDDVLVQHDDEL